MTRHIASRYRAAIIASLAIGAVMGSTGVAAADSESGQHGHYKFKDNQTKPAVHCIYSGSNPYKLTSMTLKAPGVWWPDTDSNNNREHGRVGWQVAVQVSLPGGYGPWKTLYKSTLEKKTAYEDHPLYDPNDKAALSKLTLSFNPKPYASSPNAYVRLEGKVYWYKPDGSVMGTVVHDFFYYKWVNTTGITASTGACPIRYWPS